MRAALDESTVFQYFASLCSHSFIAYEHAGRTAPTATSGVVSETAELFGALPRSLMACKADAYSGYAQGPAIRRVAGALDLRSCTSALATPAYDVLQDALGQRGGAFARASPRS